MAYKMKPKSPMAKSCFKKKTMTLTASCKAWGKRNYDVWPSAYASAGAVKAQKSGKC